MLLSVALAASGLALMAMPASAQEVSTIAGGWAAASPPTSVPSGTPVPAAFYVNLNDDRGASGARENYTVTLTAGHGMFDQIPGNCRTDSGAVPKSTLSKDGRTVTCNLGTVSYGTAMRIGFVVVASGVTGDSMTASAASDSGTVALPPIGITSVPMLDVIGNAAYGSSNGDVVGSSYFEWGVAYPVDGVQPSGDITFSVEFQSPQKGPAAYTDHGFRVVGAGTPSGCRWSTGNGSSTIPPTVGAGYDLTPASCTVVPNPSVPNKWDVTVSGYDIPSVPPKVSGNGTSLPTGQAVFLSGEFEVTSDTPLGTLGGHVYYTNTTPGWTEPDTSNNVTGFTWTSTGGAAAGYGPTANHLEWAADLFMPIGAGNPVDTGNSYTQAWTQSSTSSSCLMVTGNQELLARTPAPPSVPGFNLALWSRGDSGNRVFVTDLAQALLDAGAITVQTSDQADLRVWETACDGVETWSAPTVLSSANTDAQFLSSGLVHLPDAGSVTAEMFTIDWSKKCGDLTCGELADRDGLVGLNLAGYAKVVSGNVGDDLWVAGSALNPVTGAWVGPQDSVKITATPATAAYSTTTGLLDYGQVVGGIPYVAKAASVSAASNGDSVGWTVTTSFRQTSGGTLGTYQWSVVDTLPLGFAYVDGSASGPSTAVGPVVGEDSSGRQTLTWDVKDVANHDSAIEYRTTVSGADTGTYTNTAAAPNPLVPGNVATAAGGNLASASVAVWNQADTVLTKTALRPSMVAGDQSSNQWRIELLNQDSTSQAVTDVIDVLPYTGDANGSRFSGTYTVDGVSATIPGTGPAPTVLYSTAAPGSIDVDPAAASNGGLGMTTPVSTWTSAKPASGITAIRVVGSDLPTGGTEAVVVDWTAVGVRIGDVYENVAYAHTSGTVLQMVKAAASTLVADGSKLQTHKTLVAASGYGPGDTVMWRVEVRNASGSDALAVVVKDAPGAGLDPSTEWGADLSQGSVDASSGNWDVGTLKAGATATGTVTATIAKGYLAGTPVENRALVWNPSNPSLSTCAPNDSVASDTDQCDVTGIPLLQVHKSFVSASGWGPGDTVAWRVEVRNGSVSDADGVRVSDLPGAGLAAGGRAWGDLPQGSVDPGTGDWLVGTLKAGQTLAATVVTTIADGFAAGGELANQASASSPLAPWRGACAANADVLSDVDQCDAAEQSTSLLQVHKAVKLTTGWSKGWKVTWTVEVHNGGAAPASDVDVTDVPGAGFDPNHAWDVPGQGSIDPVTNVWHVGALAPGQTVTDTVQTWFSGDVRGGASYENRVTVSSPMLPRADADGCVADDAVSSDTDQCDVRSVQAPLPRGAVTGDPVPAPGLPWTFWGGLGLLVVALGGGWLGLRQALRGRPRRVWG